MTEASRTSRLALALLVPVLAAVVWQAPQSIALWLLEGSPGLLVLCGIFLAAASLTKSEGFVLSVALVAALAGA